MTYLKTFRSMGNWSQLFFLCFFAFGGFILGIFLSLILGAVMQEDITNPSSYSLSFMRISQVVSVVCWLLVSAFLFLALFKEAPRSYLKTDTKVSWLYIPLVILLVVAVQPLVELSGYLNEQISFPQPLENYFQHQKEISEAFLNRFVADTSIIGIILNIFVIAVTAAVVEEIFFRGCMQQIFVKIVKNKHVGVWITAIIFSAIHMEFYAFIPRVLLGAMLGYIYLWSGSLWMPMLAHFLNNLGALIMYGTPEYEELISYNPESNVIYIVASIVLTVVIGYLFVRLNKRKIPENKD